MRLYNAVARAELAGLAPWCCRQAATLYGHQLGLYPEIHNGEARHGGTPLVLDRGRLAAHGRKVRAQVAGLSGLEPGSLVQIDYEAWPPVLPAEGPYRDAAVAWADATYAPRTSPARRLALAAARWRRHAVALYLATLRAARQARPDLRYGYYYPQSRHYWPHKAYDGPNGDASRAENDVLADVWASVDWYPASLYWPYAATPDDAGHLPAGHAHERDLRRYVRHNLGEWQRLRGGAMDKPVIAIVEPSVHVGNRILAHNPLAEYDWRVMLGESRDAGADGVMVWGVAGLTGLDARGHAEAARLYGRVYAELIAEGAN